VVERDDGGVAGRADGPLDCAHHWQIETPSGETSTGVCKLCGAVRSFANYTATRTMTRSPRATSRSSQRLDA
jgi:hypothetical protein